jgi:hypothetical protein
MQEQGANDGGNHAEKGQPIKATRIAAGPVPHHAYIPGTEKPPKFPRELIQAIEAAAAVPVRNIGGIDQKGPFEP